MPAGAGERRLFEQLLEAAAEREVIVAVLERVEDDRVEIGPVLQITRARLAAVDVEDLIARVRRPDEAPLDPAAFFGDGHVELQPRAALVADRLRIVVERVDALDDVRNRRTRVETRGSRFGAGRRVVVRLHGHVVTQVDVRPGRGDLGARPFETKEDLDLFGVLLVPAHADARLADDAEFEVEHGHRAQLLVLRVERAVDVHLEAQAAVRAVPAPGDGVDALVLFDGVEVGAALRGEGERALRAVGLNEADGQVERLIEESPERRVHHAASAGLEQQSEAAPESTYRPSHR